MPPPCALASAQVNLLQGQLFVDKQQKETQARDTQVELGVGDFSHWSKIKAKSLHPAWHQAVLFSVPCQEDPQMWQMVSLPAGAVRVWRWLGGREGTWPGLH